MPDFSERFRRRLTSGFSGFNVRRKSSTGSSQSGQIYTEDLIDSRCSPSLHRPADIQTALGYFQKGLDNNPPPAYSFVEAEAVESPLSDASFEPEIECDDPPGPATLIAHAPTTTRVNEGLDSLTVIRGQQTGWAEAQLATFEHALEDDSTDSAPIFSSFFDHQFDLSYDRSALSRVPSEILMIVLSHLPPEDAASFALTNRTVARRIGRPAWNAIKGSEHIPERCRFLERLAPALPMHLLCYHCGYYHARRDPGSETVRWPAGYAKYPLTRCLRQDLGAPFVRVTADRGLPFALCSLATAPARLGHPHGIPLSRLSRSWTSSGGPGSDPRHTWTHRTSFALFDPHSRNGDGLAPSCEAPHLIMRVTSMFRPRGSLAPSAARLALASRTDYTSNYCACSHEARGAHLFKAARCALQHIGDSTAQAGGGENALPGSIVSQCADCRPLWHCSLCPSEYMVEAKVVETSRRESFSGLTGVKGPRFEYALIVTRWTDLGPGVSPYERTWAACSSKLTYADQDSEIWREQSELDASNHVACDDAEAAKTPTSRTEIGPRRKFERALGMREFCAEAVALRRPMHWQSKLRQDLETYMTTSSIGERPVLGGGRISTWQ